MLTTLLGLFLSRFEPLSKLPATLTQECLTLLFFDLPAPCLKQQMHTLHLLSCANFPLGLKLEMQNRSAGTWQGFWEYLNTFLKSYTIKILREDWQRSRFNNLLCLVVVANCYCSQPGLWNVISLSRWQVFSCRSFPLVWVLSCSGFSSKPTCILVFHLSPFSIFLVISPRISKPPVIWSEKVREVNERKTRIGGGWEQETLQVGIQTEGKPLSEKTPSS